MLGRLQKGSGGCIRRISLSDIANLITLAAFARERGASLASIKIQKELGPPQPEAAPRFV